MAKRGGKKHVKRMAAPKAIPIHDKKETVWLVGTSPGPHANKHSIPLTVLLRDILKVAKTSREAKRILANRMVEVDRRVRTSEKFPVGLMDVVSIPKSGKHYRILVDHKGKLLPVEIGEKDSSKKLVKVIKKHTIKGGKLNITFHDGKNLLADNHMKVGDTALVSLPNTKIEQHIKRDTGIQCLIMEGKHAGNLVKLKEIIQRKGGKPSEALVEDKAGKEFVTVANYLFVVGQNLEGEAA